MTINEKSEALELARIHKIIGKKTRKGMIDKIKKYHPNLKITVLDKEKIGKNLVWKCL